MSAAMLMLVDDQAMKVLRRVGGEKLVRELIRLFLLHAPARVEAAINGAEEGDLERVERALHSLRATAGQLGLSGLRDLCTEGERLAEEGVAQSLPALAQQVRESFEAVVPLLVLLRGADVP